MQRLSNLLNDLTLIRNADGSYKRAKDGSFERKRIIFVARPAAFDFSWLYSYYQDFLRSVPKMDPRGEIAPPLKMHFSATCVSTMRDSYQLAHGLSRQQMDAKVKEWTTGFAVTHNPLDDARYQARLFFALCKEMGISTESL